MNYLEIKKTELKVVITIIACLWIIWILITKYRMDCILTSRPYIGLWSTTYSTSNSQSMIEISLRKDKNNSWLMNSLSHRPNSQTNGGKGQSSHMQKKGRFYVENKVINALDEQQIPVFTARLYHCNDLRVQFLQRNEEYGWPHTASFRGVCIYTRY